VEAVLLIDIGSTYTKVTAVDIAGECVVGTAKAHTTVCTDIQEGLEKAMDRLREKTGIGSYSGKLACSSAAGGLKMVAVGLVPGLTSEAAKMAALSAGAKVLKTYSYELSEGETEEIAGLKPDIILLTGGTDGGNRKVLLHNADRIAGIKGDFPVIAAGNKSAADDACRILAKGGKEVLLCENVMPEFNVLNIEPAREMIRRVFLQRIIRAKGLTKVQALVEDILMPTPSAVLRAASLLSKGCGTEKGLGELLVADVGGATTDIYSISDGSPASSGIFLKGLPEPFEKRTVEGDLGVRYSAGALMEAAGADAVAARAGLTAGELADAAARIASRPDLLAFGTDRIGRLDHALASLAVKLGVERHAGRIGSTWSAFGEVFVQTGKDLGRVARVVGTGGPVIHAVDPKGILKEALFDETRPEILKPRKAEFLLDQKYILAAMGLLGGRYPEIAVKIMKRELEMI
jgi:uncharacterized protein (TIGR01319 family)